MVISKRVLDAVQQPKQPETADEWHDKDGELTAVATKMYDRMYDHLDACGQDLGYPQLKQLLVEQFPDEYTDSPGNVDITDKSGKVRGQRLLISNIDVKIIVTEMVKDGLVVD